MATVFKTFLNDDIATTRTLLHEAIPIHGGIVFGVYNEDDPEQTNIKDYPHKMFQSVYDYPYLSSSANHIFDLTVGLTEASDLLSPDDISAAKKQRIYQQMAQVLVGHDAVGNILKFDEDGNILEGGDKFDEVYIISAARLLNKDEIKKGSCFTQLDVGREPAADGDAQRSVLYISDEGSANDYRVNSPAGDYGILRCRSHQVLEADADGNLTVPVAGGQYDYEASAEADGIDARCGLIYYQAGVVVLSPYIFEKNHPTYYPDGKLPVIDLAGTGADANDEMPIMYTDDDMLTHFVSDLKQDDGAGGISTTDASIFRLQDIPTNCTGLRRRMNRLAFNNTTELNSTIYFCRINHNDFNYSSNPTYLDESKIRVKESTEDAPVSYISTVGLYSADNELLAVAKLSEVLRKDPTNEMVLRVRLDY